MKYIRLNKVLWEHLGDNVRGSQFGSGRATWYDVVTKVNGPVYKIVKDGISEKVSFSMENML